MSVILFVRYNISPLLIFYRFCDKIVNVSALGHNNKALKMRYHHSPTSIIIL